MRLIIFTLIFFFTGVQMNAQDNCLAESGFLGVFGQITNDGFVFGHCNPVGVAVSGNNTLTEYSTAFFITQGENYTIVDTLFNFEGAFENLAPGEYCVHALNYNNTENIPSLPNIGGSMNILFQNPNACISVNNSGNTSEALNACIPITVLEPITVLSEHECAEEVNGEFIEIFSIFGGLPAYDSNYGYYLSGDLNFPDGLLFEDAQNIIVNYTDNVQVTLVASDDTMCDEVVYQPDYGPCVKTAIELNYLRAEVLDNGNLLSWSTASEFENNYFIVQSSNDGVSFNTIETIQGAGNSTLENNYSFLDLNAISGKTFYKISAVDFNGIQTSFDIIETERNDNNFSINSVHPSPAVSDLTVNFNSNVDGLLQYEIFNLTGAQVEAGTFFANIGNNDLPLNIVNLTTGVYLLNINNGNEAITAKIIKK